MYDGHYGLTGRPFQLTPDSKFWFDTATHRKAMAYLSYGLSQGEGFVVITGDPGSGKTTLMNHLLGQIDAERLNVIKLVSSQLVADDLLRLVCAGLDIDSARMPKAEILGEIERGLHAVARSGRRTLLVIDEAQALASDSLEELRMLSNFQAGGHPLLQIFLLGQPEFRETLSAQSLEQLRQRVIAMHHLEPMEPEEVEPYLIHRLSRVGWSGTPRFTADALAELYRWSGGSPRRLNQLASRVMLYGAVEEIETFTGVEIKTVIADLDNDLPPISTPSAQVLTEASELQEVVRLSNGASAEELSAIRRRLEALEAQIEQQDAALRRVLTLLVNWVESDTADNRPDISSIRDTAA